MAVLRKVIYKLPPRVRVVSNPHYVSTGDTNYAPYTFESLGPYPLGDYYIGSNSAFGGTQKVTASTETSITVLYRTRPGTYPSKINEQFIDINDWEFAYKPYRKTAHNGTTQELLYHPEIFDFSPQSPGISRLSFTTQIFFEKGFSPFDASNNSKGYFFNKGDPLLRGNIDAYGFAMVQIPDLPGFQHSATDPTPMGIVPKSVLSAAKGRYLIIVKNIGGFSSFSSYEIYPQLPNDRNIELNVVGIDGPNLGVEFTLHYDSIYKSLTGPGNSYILPYRYSKKSTTQPTLIYLPDGTSTGDIVYYLKESDDSFIPFDINVGSLSLRGTPLPERSVPANFLQFG